LRQLVPFYAAKYPCSLAFACGCSGNTISFYSKARFFPAYQRSPPLHFCRPTNFADLLALRETSFKRMVNHTKQPLLLGTDFLPPLDNKAFFSTAHQRVSQWTLFSFPPSLPPPTLPPRLVPRFLVPTPRVEQLLPLECASTLSSHDSAANPYKWVDGPSYPPLRVFFRCLTALGPNAFNARLAFIFPNNYRMLPF